MVHKLLTGHASYIDMSSTSCLLCSDGCKIIIDTGSVEERGMLLKSLEKFHIKPDDIDIVANTHLHMDHCWNNELFPNACHYCSEKELMMLVNMVESINSNKVKIDEIIRAYLFLSDGIPRLLKKKVVHFFCKDRIFEKILLMKRINESVMNELGLQVIETPGHTDGHISLIYEKKGRGTKYIFLGDAIINKECYGQKHKKVLFTKDICQYRISKHKIEKHRGIYFPGHGGEFCA